MRNRAGVSAVLTLVVERAMRHRAPLLWVLAPYGVGVALARCFPSEASPGLWLCPAVFCAGCALILGHRQGTVAGCLLITGSALAGMGRCWDERKRSPAFDGLPPRAVQAIVEIEHLYPRAKAGRTAGLARIVHADAPPDYLGQRVAFSLKLPPSGDVHVGETLSAWFVAEWIPDHSPPDTFEGHLIASGVNVRARRGQFEASLKPPGLLRRKQQAALAACRRWLAAGLTHRPDLVAVHHGLLLGEVRALGDDQKALFSETGTMHLFSVSGLHIGVVALVMHVVLARLPLRARVGALVPLLGLYVYVTGASPAAVRAFWMITALELGRAFQQRPNPLSALCFAALLSLLGDPMQLFSASFQYSYGIVASLVLFGGPLQQHLDQRLEPFASVPGRLWRWWHHASSWLMRKLVSALSLGVSASLVGEICTLHYFHLLTPGGLLVNVILIPLSSLAIVAGMIALGAGLVGMLPLCSFFNHAAAVVIAAMLGMLEGWHAAVGGFYRASFIVQPLGMGLLAACILTIYCGYLRQWRPHRWLWFAPWLVLFTALVFGTRFG